MTRRQWIFLGASVLLVALCAATNVHAAEEGNSAKTAAENLFKWINFAIVAGAILWLFGKYLPPKFRKNADDISAAIKKATAARVEAQRQLREAEARLANLEKEVTELRAAAQRESAAEVQRVRAATQSDAQKIAMAARAEIEAAERAARLELKAIAATMAVEGAESLLAKQLTPTAQEALINQFVKTLDARPN